MASDTADRAVMSILIILREAAEDAAGGRRKGEQYHFQQQHEFKFAEADCETTPLLCY